MMKNFVTITFFSLILLSLGQVLQPERDVRMAGAMNPNYAGLRHDERVEPHELVKRGRALEK